MHLHPRRPRKPEYRNTYRALMLALGCDSALNLDGGGSSEIVRADTLGKPFILNNPSGGAERFDAAALGVYALPLPTLPFNH